MPSISLDAFKEELYTKFPNLKKHSETRLFTVLMEAGVDVDFEVGKDGGTIVSYNPLSPDSEKKLSQA